MIQIWNVLRIEETGKYWLIVSAMIIRSNNILDKFNSIIKNVKQDTFFYQRVYMQ